MQKLHLDSNNISPYLFLKKCVDQEKMIILVVNADELNYDYAFKQSRGWIHCFNVIGYDKDNFIISDGYVPSRVPKVYEGSISFDIVIEAWKKKRFKYYLIELDDFKNKDFSNSMLILKKVKESLENFLYVDSKDSFKGFQAFYRLLEVIETNYNYESFCDLSKEIVKNLKTYGFISMRVSLLSIIKELKLPLNIYEKYSCVLQKIDLFCLLLIKLGFSRSNSDYKKLLYLGNNIIVKEKEVFDEIVNC